MFGSCGSEQRISVGRFGDDKLVSELFNDEQSCVYNFDFKGELT